jgi:hypothetical protein
MRISSSAKCAAYSVSKCPVSVTPVLETIVINMKLELFLLAVMFTCSTIANAAQDPLDAADPEPKSAVNWTNVAATVPPILVKRSHLEWSDELAAKMETADAESLIVSLEVFLRAGQPERVSKTIRLLGKAAGLGRTAASVADRLLKRGWFEQARLWFDTFPLASWSWDSDMMPLLTWMAENQGQAAADAWLREQSRREQESQRNWEHHLGMPWSGLYWRQLAASGKLSGHVAGLRQEIEKKPSDFDLVSVYLAASVALPDAERPSQDWLAEVLRLEHAMDNFVLARHFAFDKNYKAAIHFCDRSLACQITDYDRQRFNAAGLTQMYVPPEKVESFLRRWTKAELAEACFHDGKLDRAQKLVEELTGKKGGALDDLGPFLLAGQVQAASGQRVVEGQIKKAEEEQKDSIQYWLNRAKYYTGRGEKDQVEQAYKSAMNLPADRPFRGDLVRDYGGFLQANKRFKDAERLYRDEIDRVGVQNAESWLKSLWWLNVKGKARFGWDEPLIWSWLNAQKAAGFPQAGQMFLGDLASHADNWAAFERKARELAGDSPPPALQFCLGQILYKHDQSRDGLQMMQSAYSRWPDKVYPPAGYIGEQVLQALLKQNEAKAAEAVVDKLLADPAYGVNDPSYGWSTKWLGDFALEAARNGAADLAMRLWERKAALDLGDLEGLEVMAAKGLRDRLEKFYRDLSKKAPDNKTIEAALAKLKK